MFYLLLSLGWGAPPEGDTLVVDEEIVVTATQQTEVYVAPTKVVHNGKSFDLDTQTVFTYANSHKYMAKFKGDYGYYSRPEWIDVYSSDTVGFMYEDCKWSETPKKCSFENDMWFLESVITLGEEHATLRLVLYDENMLVLSQSVISNVQVEQYIERKKTSRVPVTVPGGILSGQNCGTTCAPQIRTGPQTRMQVEEEDLPPTKITIPARLLDKDIHQASMRLWVAVKID